MKAAIYREYGEPLEVLSLEEIEKPVPKDDEVLIRVRAAGLNPLDSHLMTTFLGRLMTGLRKPKYFVPGRDLAGTVETVGSNVTRFKAGDEVFGCCKGACAEYAATPEKSLAAKPTNISFEEAAAVGVAGFTALQGLRDPAKLQAGERVLIIGASGGVGTFAVQIAKVLGAHVTAVCSEASAELVRSLGADEVLDRRKDYLTGGPYDAIFDIVAAHGISDYARVLTPKGRYVGAGILGQGPPSLRFFPELIKQTVATLFISQKFTNLLARLNADDLAALAELLADVKIRSVIDRSYPLAETAQAIQYVREKRARGKVVVTIS